MKFYRIKQIGDNAFIPQVKIGLIGSWDGIDTHTNIAWYSGEYQVKWCCVDTFELAEQRIKKFKLNVLNKKKYPKYHKIK